VSIFIDSLYMFISNIVSCSSSFFCQAEDGIRDRNVTGVQTCALPILDPFDDVQDTDYQLARSLIAFGRGQFTGVGYGESVQKLSHLPEAHTDFLLAITGEELGFVGV